MPSPPPEQTINRRRLSFLIWSSVVGVAVYSFISLLLLPFRHRSSLSLSLLSLPLFQISHLFYSFALYLLASPRLHPAASPLAIAAALVGTLIKSLIGGSGRPDLNIEFRRKVRQSLACLLFVLACGVSGFFAAISIAWEDYLMGWKGLAGLGLNGVVFGLLYSAHYLYSKRWILKFPIIQRPLFFSFKMVLPSSSKLAVSLSTPAFFCSSVMMLFLPDHFKSKKSIGRLIIHLIYLYIGISAVSFCWELSHNLLQVIYTRRCCFAPSKGSAAAETNPSETLLEALEQIPPGSLLQYLAYLDLCTVSESNIEPWRRAAFFEESGETYRRVISLSLRPLKQFTSRLVETFEGFSADKLDILSQQLSPTNALVDSRLHEAFNDFQLLTWCSRTAAALTAHSHAEDRYGVAQLTGCNATVLSTLLSCLLAVEACLGKKTNPQSSQFMGPASIRWATVNTSSRVSVAVAMSKKRSTVIHAQAYVMADVLRTSIYHMISVFEADMLSVAKASALEKNWISEGKPLYGTREVLVQKLQLFLEFRAV